MLRKSIPLIIIIMLVPALVLAADNSKTANYDIHKMLPVMRGDEPITVPFVFPSFKTESPTGLDDFVGDTVTIGRTWYDNQHNGTIGRMIAKDDSDYVHMVWMKGMEAGVGNARHVWYNVVQPNGIQIAPYTGSQIDASTRAGYVTLDVAWIPSTPAGYGAFPAFHQAPSEGANPHTAVGADFSPHLGGFYVYEPEWLYEGGLPMELIWPHVQIDRNDVMHILSTEYVLTAGASQRQYYTSGTYDYSTGIPTITFPSTPDSSFRMIGVTMTIAGDVATSEVSDRVAFAWTVSRDTSTQWNNDVWVLIDNDGEDIHFQDAFNLTQFIPPNLVFLPDSFKAEMDTFRAYTDLSVFIDQDNYTHVVFTTPSYFELHGILWWCSSMIWHWSEQFPSEFQVVDNAFDVWWPSEQFTPRRLVGEGVDCGNWNVKAQRAELGQDPSTGYLYCMWQRYDTDTTHLSQFFGSSGYGLPSGEIYVSVSEDGGMNWAVGTNVTNTITPTNAAPNDCRSELTPSVATGVDEYVHILYCEDLDAGNIAQSEGVATDNPMVYQMVPVNLIPHQPLVPQYPDPGGVPFHVFDSTLTNPYVDRYVQPKVFGLKQNYPNPFNPTTSITFSLDQVSEVALNVYNLNGQLVAGVAAGTYGTGEHSVSFDGAGLASGIYIYKLKAGNRTLERKMLLLK